MSKRKFFKPFLKIFTVFLTVAVFTACVVFICFAIEKKYIYPLKYKEEITFYANKYGIKESLIFAVVKVESGFNENAVSSKNAIGLMQITEKTASYIAKLKGVENYDLKDIKCNLDFGVFYIKYLTGKFRNTEVMLTAYNAGEGNVAFWLTDKRYSLDGITLNKIPYAETEAYVKKIRKTMTKYQKLYGNIVDKT